MRDAVDSFGPVGKLGHWLKFNFIRRFLSLFWEQTYSTSRRDPSTHQMLWAVADAGILILVTDCSGKVFNVTSDCARRLGSTPSEIKGRFAWEFSDDAAETSHIKEVFRPTGGGECPSSYVSHWRGSNGEVQIFAWSVHRTPSKIMLVGQNISEIRWAETNLARANVSARLLLEQIPAVIWTVDLNLMITTSFGGALSGIGYKSDQLVGVPLADYLNTRDPDDLNIIRHRRALAGETVVYEGEVMGRILGSTLIPLRDEAGGVRGAIGLAIDVTEQRKLAMAYKQQSEELRIILDTCPSYVWFKDRNNVILRANAAAAKSVNCTVEQMAGRSAYELYPIDAAKYHRDDLEVINSGTAKLGIVERYEHSNGDLSWVSTDKLPYLDTQGKVMGVVVFATDITEQKMAEENLRRVAESEKKLRVESQRLSSMKDEFLTTLSHEIRSPLTPIIGWSDVLLAKPDTNAETRTILEIINRNAKAQLQLVEDLLDSSRILAGKLIIKPEVVNLAALIHAAQESVQPSMHAKQIQFEVQVAQPGIIVVGDSLRLQQVIWNLLANAIKFTPSGGSIQVRLSQTKSEVMIKVSDSGIGIKTELLQEMFERFRQGDSTITRKYGGLGLGLSLVRQLVEAHGGVVTAESEGLGCGSTFTIRLPNEVAGQTAERMDNRGSKGLAADQMQCL